MTRYKFYVNLYPPTENSYTQHEHFFFFTYDLRQMLIINYFTTSVCPFSAISFLFYCLVHRFSNFIPCADIFIFLCPFYGYPLLLWRWSQISRQRNFYGRCSFFRLLSCCLSYLSWIFSNLHNNFLPSSHAWLHVWLFDIHVIDTHGQGRMWNSHEVWENIVTEIDIVSKRMHKIFST